MNKESKIFELFDETMEINHQITCFLVEIAEADMNGLKINGKRNIGLKEIEENGIIKSNFQNLQKKYREIQKLILEMYDDDEKLANEGIFYVGEDRYDPNYFTKQLIDDLQNAYISLNYIGLEDEDGNTIIKDIFEGKAFANLHGTEFYIQNGNISAMEERMKFEDKSDKLSFEQKAIVLNDLAKKLFYENFSMKQISKYIKVIEENKDEMTKERYEVMREKLYEQKYALIYEYLNNKYNGILQINDIGKIGKVNAFIDAEAITVILNMQQDEIIDIVNNKILEYRERLKSNVKIINQKYKKLGRKQQTLSFKENLKFKLSKITPKISDRKEENIIEETNKVVDEEKNEIKNSDNKEQEDTNIKICENETEKNSKTKTKKTDKDDSKKEEKKSKTVKKDER